MRIGLDRWSPGPGPLTGSSSSVEQFKLVPVTFSNNATIRKCLLCVTVHALQVLCQFSCCVTSASKCPAADHGACTVEGTAQADTMVIELRCLLRV